MKHPSSRRKPHALASLLLALAGCSGASGGGSFGHGATGDSCATNEGCASGLCLGDTFSGGYCATDCTQAACATGEVCTAAAGSSFCLKGCASKSDCRAGYRCGGAVCLPPCQGDGDCGQGFGCTAGDCAPLPGAPVGTACGGDDECSSRNCDPRTSTCQLACKIEADCPPAQTCFVNPISTR